MAKSVFRVVLIKPTHYDDQGYPIRWMRSLIPSNSLACVYGLCADVRDRRALGEDVDIQIEAIDETNRVLDPRAMAREILGSGQRALICLVGVQTNQFPRAMDLAGPFLEAGIPVSMGGFHVSGCLSMLKEIPPEIADAQARGVSLFAGEAEDGRMEAVLRDAWAGELKPVYDFLKAQPSLAGEPAPILPQEHVKRTYGLTSSFDLGRGCPFQCSFCTIINVQGRKSRFRNADDLEAVVRANIAQGVNRFFITDDNLARNRDWEAAFDRLIKLREEEGLKLALTIQVDTLSHKIPNFVDKAVAAGVETVFFGLESINAESLAAVKKKQNRLHEYKDLFHAWKRHPVILTCGYIIGFPGDTPETVARDIEIIKREFPIDLMYFTNLTPLPGSEDHKRLHEQGVWMDPDLNKYDLNHRVTHHEVMTDAEWDATYEDVWRRFYSYEHMVTILRRMVALGSNKKRTTVRLLTAYREFRHQYGLHPLDGGLVRVQRRWERRPGMARESWLGFHIRRSFETVTRFWAAGRTYVFLVRNMRRIWSDPEARDYSDAATVRPEANGAKAAPVVDMPLLVPEAEPLAKQA